MTNNQPIQTTNQKIALITGATSGIGRATVLGLISQLSILILPVRSLAKGEELKIELLAINPSCQIDLYECDLESTESMKSCAKIITTKYKSIDILINNAGVMEPDFRLTDDNIEVHFEVNVLSQYIFNTILEPLVVNSNQGRIINLSSALHSQGKYNLEIINTKPAGNLPGIGLYANSNLYRNLLTLQLADKLRNTNVIVNCVHPGVIKTNLGNNSSNWIWNTLRPLFGLFTKPALDGAKTSLHLALSPEVSNITGKYWSDSTVKQPSKDSLNMQYAKELTTKCQQLTQI